jgi:hypothetical protein
MDSYDFEHLVADLWARQGWDTEVSQASSDAGIDVIATKENPYPQKKLIQAKRYGSNTTVGSPDMQQYYSLKEQEENVDSVVIVTSNEFTRDAEKRAQELNVKTVDGDELVELIDRLNGYSLLNKYDTSAVVSGSRSGATSTAEFTTVTESDTITESDSPSSGIGTKILSGAGSLFSRVSRDAYFRVIQGCTVVWTVMFLVAQINFTGAAAFLGLVMTGAWVLFPPALYYEGERTERETDWSPRRKLYAIAGAVPFINALAGGVYLFRRKRAYKRARSHEVGSSSSIDVESAGESSDSITERSE